MQQDLFLEVVEKRKELSTMIEQYLKLHSNIATWQFWINILLLIVPLIILYFLIDRKKIFEIGFYGFSIHMMVSYLDIYGIKEGLWGYPYQISGKLASNVALDSSLIPISFMLIYQYFHHRTKLFYLITLGGTIIFSFLIKPGMTYINLFWIGQEMSYTKLWMFYLVGIGIPILITNFFKYLKENPKK